MFKLSLLLYIYIIWTILLALYIHSYFDLLKDIFLRKAGIKLKIKGYKNEIPKLIKVFIIKNIWVFWYTAQNEDK